MSTKIYLISLSILFMISCERKEIMIAISKSSGSANYHMYEEALLSYNKSVKVVDLFQLSYDSALKIINIADGLLLSGGPDIHPSHFGKTADTAKCSIDLHRDSLEFALINIAIKRKIPILGICRGLQILNVAAGGSLITDIPSDYPSNIIHQIESGDAMHDIMIFEGSLLKTITDMGNEQVNSNHHQAIDKLAEIFKVTATSSDGIIEAIEYKQSNMPYLMAVQ